MKKTLLLTVLALAFSFVGIAQEWHGITSDSPVNMKKTLVSSTENEIVVNMQIGGFYTKTVNTPDGPQVVISYDKMASMLEAGAPDLPMEPISAIIGDRAEMKVSVMKSTYVDFKDIEVAPSKGNFSRQINPDDVPYTYGEMYSQDAFWPATQAYLEKPYILRDFRGQNIMVQPFAYNPVTKVLRVYTDMTIAMTKVSDNGENQKTARKSNTIKVDPEQMAQYDKRFINFGETGAKYTFDEDFGEMLIICADMYMSNLQPLVEWKNQSGRPTTLVSLSTAGGNNSTNIKNYISNFYNDPAHNLEFILLVGEYNDLTPYMIDSGKRSDNWFGKLEGNDDYLDALVGRLSVANAADADLQVNKIIYYERDVQAGAAWGNKGMGIGYYGAGSGHYGEDDYQHIDLIRDTLLHYTYSVVTEHHGGSGGDASVATISGTINEGISIINYCNHGSVTSWGVANYSTSNVAALTNDNMLPIVWSVACLNGQFDTGTCFGESWLRAKNNTTGNPTGAVGGMFSWISQPWIPPMYGQDEMVEILCEWQGGDQFNHTLGGASLNGSMDILDKAPGDSEQTFNTWLLFGDPSLMVRTDIPTAMNVNATPSTLMLGMSSLTVTANNTAYGIATLSDENGIIATAKIVNGTATLTFPALSTVETATLTVIGYNKVTEVIPVEILPAEGAYLTLESYSPTNVPCVDPQQMTMTFKNVGVDATTGNTTVTLSSENENITITDNTASFGPLAADATVTLTDEFAFTIAAGVPDNTNIQINYAATCGTETWNGVMNVTVGAPIIEYAGMEYSGGFTPGESVNVTAVFHNAGHYQATNAVVTASTTSEYATIVNPTATVGTIGVGEDGEAAFEIAIDEACPESTPIVITFTLTADNEVTATGEGIVSNTCVVVFSLHDSYGDGWNGCALSVVYSDGTPTESLTIASGHEAEYEKEISIGTVVTVSFVVGSYASECSFEIGYQDGDQIYASSGTPTAGQVCQFAVNCSSITYEITAVANPENAGTITGAGTLHEGSTCTLTAIPGSEYSFVNWTRGGDIVSTNPVYSFIVSEDADFVANFAPFQGVVIGEGTATDEKLPSYSYYKYGLSEQIYTADEIGMTGVITSLAFFNGGAEKTRQMDIYMVHTQKSEFSSGTDWIAVTAADQVFGGTVVMTAGEWTTLYLTTPFIYDGTNNLAIVVDDNSGDYTSSPHMACRVFSTTGSQAITIWNDNTNFDPTAPSGTGTLKEVKNQVRLEMTGMGDMRHITVAANPVAGGTVTGGGYYNLETSVTITATANTGYTFINWTKDNEVVTTNASYTFTVTEDANYIANFEINSYEITVAANNDDYGTVTGGGTFNHGESATIVATPNEGYVFVDWRKGNAVVSTNATYTFTVTEAGDYIANFEEYVPATYDVVVSAEPADFGTVDGGGTYTEGDECTVTAEPVGDAYFVNWTENGQVVSTEMEYTFTVTANRTLVAHFAVDGVEELTEMNVVLYPNPTENKVYIEGEDIEYVELYNAMGQKMMVVEGNYKVEVDVTTFEKGVYYLRIVGKGIKSQKLIVK